MCYERRYYEKTQEQKPQPVKKQPAPSLQETEGPRIVPDQPEPVREYEHA